MLFFFFGAGCLHVFARCVTQKHKIRCVLMRQREDERFVWQRGSCLCIPERKTISALGGSLSVRRQLGEVSILNLDGDQHKRLYFRTNDDVRERRGETRHPKEHSVWKPCASVGSAHATERLEWQESD